MRRLLGVLVVGCAAALAGGAGPAGATRECSGFMVCVPVAGPWVMLPPDRRAPRAPVEYRLSCPRHYVVGGLDAELSDRGIDIGFVGALGSPVNPGITTSRAVVFVGRYVGSSARATSFRPHIGCIPAAGGGGRVPTVASRVFPPGQPTVRRVRTVRFRPGPLRVVQACAAGERLVAASHAVGFFTAAPPSQRLAGSVSTAHVVRGGRVIVSGHAGGLVRGLRAVVQVSAVCAGGE
jgi:hypothetical protein